jgi:hypothetical protein
VSVHRRSRHERANRTRWRDGRLAPRGIGEILSAAFQLYRRYWRTLVAIAAVVVVPLTLLQYGIGHWVRTNGQQIQDQGVVSTWFWAVASASLLATLVGLLLYLDLRARKERLDLDTLKANLQASTA